MLDEDTYIILKRYQEALQIERDKDKFRCPNTECEKVLSLKELKKSSKGKKALVCNHCEKEICKKCNLLDHPGKRCIQTDEGKFRLWASMSSGVKNCPVCSCRTQKNSGCNHMHCERCQADWCWICNQECNETHYEPTRIFTGCPGMQFLGGGGLKMGLILFSIFILNPIVFAIGPILFAFLAGFYLAGEWTSLSI